jgi:hypothetical protein
MKRRYYNPFLARARTRGVDDASQGDRGQGDRAQGSRGGENLGQFEDEIAASGGAANAAPDSPPAPASRRVPARQQWYLLPPGMSITMALARVPAATRNVTRRATPPRVLMVGVVLLTLALGALQLGLLRPALRPLGASQPDPLPAGNDWTHYRFDDAGSGFNPEQTLSSANVA